MKLCIVDNEGTMYDVYDDLELVNLHNYLRQSDVIVAIRSVLRCLNLDSENALSVKNT